MTVESGSPARTLSAPEGASTPAVLAAVGVEKRYGGVHALRGASLEIHAGEIHGLLGANGSGKSSLLRILSGQTRLDGGCLEMDGRPIRFPDPLAALGAGIAIVTQETTLVPDLSVAENVLLGRRLVRTTRGIDWAASRRCASDLLRRVALDVDPRSTVARLRPDQQQMVEIARAISMDARVLILDEPTSSLTDDEVEALMEVVRGLAAEGVATIFVSHRTKEVRALVDRVTVLRDGQTVGGGHMTDLDDRQLLHLIVGDELEEFVHSDSTAESGGLHALRLRGLSVAGHVRDLDLEVRAGEIVGIAGLAGAGRSEVLAACFGAGAGVTGSIEVRGRAVRLGGPRDAIRHGVGYVPASRKADGLVFTMSVRENLLMAQRTRHSRWRRVRSQREALASDALIAQLGVKVADPDASVAALSGGNQQKVLIGKWLATGLSLLLLDEPTRGVDVGIQGGHLPPTRGCSRRRPRGRGLLLGDSRVAIAV